MEARILNSLKDIRYTDVADNILLKAIELGSKDLEYAKIVYFLCNELKVLCNIDEQVNLMTNTNESIMFLMELSSFLKELGCPYACLTQGHISDRLSSYSEKLLLLDYLLSELMASRVLRDTKPEKKMELKLQESPQAADLRKVLVTLRFPKPPANITVQQLFQKLSPAVQTVVQKAGKDLLGNSIFNGFLSEKQWSTLESVQKDLSDDYTIRREMLLKRLDCTIQSFEWSDKTSGKDELIEKIYTDKRKLLKVNPEVDLSDLLVARDSIAVIEKTSNANVRRNTRSDVNKVIIGQVPDRGGRTSEQAPPPPEMPSWQQRTPGPPGGGGDRGGYRGGGQHNRGRGGGHNDYNSQGRMQPNNRSFEGSANYGGNNYSSAGFNYNRVGQDYNKRGNHSYSSGFSSNFMNKDFGSSLKNFNTSLSGYAAEGGFKSKCASEGRNFDSAGPYGGPNTYNKSIPKDNNYDRSTNSTNVGLYSTGSYGSKPSLDGGTEPKRAKTYDSFQTNKNTYADQYVEESQHNQQYRPRSETSGRGKSNYKRGGNDTYR